MPFSRTAATIALDALLARIASRDYNVGIMGMGYVGLPLALAAAKAGYRVIGFDIDEACVALLNRGENGFTHISSGPLAAARADRCFKVTDRPPPSGPFAMFSSRRLLLLDAAWTRERA